MLNIRILMAIFFVLIVYGASVLGIRRYQVVSRIRKMRKIEILGSFFCFALIFFGILMNVARCEGLIQGGFLTKEIINIGNVLFFENISIISLCVLMVTMIPALGFQLLLVSKFDEKVNHIPTMMFYYAFIYASNMRLYEEFTIATIGNAILYFLISVIAYYVVQLIDMPRGKKDYLYLSGLMVLAVIIWIIEGGLSVSLLIMTLFTLLECFIMSFYLGKSVILRKGLRRVGTLLILVICILLNFI